MTDVTSHLRAVLLRCLPPEEAERCLGEIGRGLRGGVPVRRKVYYRLDESTGRTVALRRRARLRDGQREGGAV